MADVREDRRALASPIQARVYSARIARTHAEGDALRYAHGPEYRDQAEVARIAQAVVGIPITLDHPEGLVAEGAPARVIGRVISAEVDDDSVVAQLLITDSAAEVEFLKGDAEVSLGYQCSSDANGYQRDIQPDHLAVLSPGDRARCGAACRLKKDAACCKSCASVHNVANSMGDTNQSADETAGDKPVAIVAPPAPSPTGGTNMDELKTALAQIETLKLELHDARKDLAAERKIAETARADAATVLQGDLDTAKKRGDDALAECERLRKDARTEALARIKLESDAGRILGVEDRTKLDDRAIKALIIKHVDGDDVAETETAQFVDGMFAGALKRHDRAQKSVADVRQAIHGRDDKKKADAKPADDEAAALADLDRQTTTGWMNSKN